MLLIKCPWCGERDESEFAYLGEAHIARPLETEKMSDEDWGTICSCARIRKAFIRNNGCTLPDVVAISMRCAIPLATRSVQPTR